MDSALRIIRKFDCLSQEGTGFCFSSKVRSWRKRIDSLGLHRFIVNLLYGVSATDPLTYAMFAILIVSISLFASTFLPGGRCALTP
jgi:hypothetical protein